MLPFVSPFRQCSVLSSRGCLQPINAASKCRTYLRHTVGLCSRSHASCISPLRAETPQQKSHSRPQDHSIPVSKTSAETLMESAKAAAASLALAVVLILSGPSGMATAADAVQSQQVMTVTASQAIDAARPLKVEPVNKPKVWAVGLFSATLLFLFTIAAENNEAWFPAISKANKAMNISKKQAQMQEEEYKLQLKEWNEQMEIERSTSIVEAGLRQARTKVLGPAPAATPSPPASSPSNPSPPSASTPTVSPSSPPPPSPFMNTGAPTSAPTASYPTTLSSPEPSPVAPTNSSSEASSRPSAASESPAAAQQEGGMPFTAEELAAAAQKSERMQSRVDGISNMMASSQQSILDSRKQE